MYINNKQSSHLLNAATM